MKENFETRYAFSMKILEGLNRHLSNRYENFTDYVIMQCKNLGFISAIMRYGNKNFTDDKHIRASYFVSSNVYIVKIPYFTIAEKLDDFTRKM